jgi:hypothetical protein
MRIENKQISDENVHVDSNEYIYCLFIRCRIIFTGKGPVRFERCTFDACDWVFDAAAEETIQYLAALYAGLGPGGRDLVEGLFDSIRQGGTGHGTLRPSTPEELVRR